MPTNPILLTTKSVWDLRIIFAYVLDIYDFSNDALMQEDLEIFRQNSSSKNKVTDLKAFNLSEKSFLEALDLYNEIKSSLPKNSQFNTRYLRSLINKM